MPPKGHGRGAGGRGGGSSSGSAASSGAAAPAPPAAAAPLLPSELISTELRSAFRELPGFADVLVPAPTQRGAPGAGAGGRLSASQEEELERCLQEVQSALGRMPPMSLDHANALAELLSQEPAAATALLKLQATALRLGMGDRLGILGVGSPLAPAWQRQAVGLVPVLLLRAAPFLPSRHALSVLRFVRAMLRAQPFHALSRVMAEAATALEAGRGGAERGGGGASSSEAGSRGSGGAGSSNGGGGAGSNSGGGAGSSSGGGAGPGGGSGGAASGSRGGPSSGSGSGGGATSPCVLSASEADTVLMIAMMYVTAVGTGLGLGLYVATTSLTPLEQSAAALSALFQTLREEVDPGLGDELGLDWDLLDAGLPAEAAEVKEERVACGEELARGLAESGFLEHATHLMLQLQTRLPINEQRKAVTDQLGHIQLLWRAAERGRGLYDPHGPAGAVPARHVSPAAATRLMLALQTSQGVQNGPVIKLQFMLKLWRALERAIGPDRLIWAPPHLGDGFVARSTSPAAAAHLRSALSGRCVQTAVLVYGVGTLRVADRGPSYGLPAQRQAAGLALIQEDKGGMRTLSPIALELLLRQLASGSAQPPPGPGASLELALRVGRAALGTAAARMPQGRASCVLPLATLLKADVPEAVRLAVGALACGRLLLPRQRPSPRLEAQREEWWQLAVGAGEVLVWWPADGPNCQLYELVTEPLFDMWADGPLDLDALPPAAPPEVAAALAAGLLPHLASVIGAGLDTGLDAGLDYGADCLPALVDACDGARPGGSGLALFLTPLLAYGDEVEARELVGLLTDLSELPPASSVGTASDDLDRATSDPLPPAAADQADSEDDDASSDAELSQQAAASFFRATAEALGRCRTLGPVTEAPAGPVEAATEGEEPPVPTAVCKAAGADPAPAHLLQLQRLLAPWLAAEGQSGSQEGG